LISTLQQREQALQQWFVSIAPSLNDGSVQGSLSAVSGDASFRRYFRGFTNTQSWILVDAPPDKENSHTFVEIARRLARGGVAVPEVMAVDLELGFMCLADFGDTLLWSKLDAVQRNASEQPHADALYHSAFMELVKIQQCDGSTPPLPLYDEALLLREMRLFTDWFCGGIMQMTLSSFEVGMLENVYRFLADAARAQPQVFVHRDYHSRNLMYRAGKSPGVIDFQDAVLGPVTYDLVSLLKDVYISWPRAQVNDWVLVYAAYAQDAGVLGHVQPQQFLRAFDLMGVQRHLKVAGIFGRLWLRDGKSRYLQDIPLTLRYIDEVVPEHPELQVFAEWLQAKVLPGLEAALASTRQNAAAGAGA
jgi:aminoglycoside/choline kinase family phosphotransferase